MASVAASPECTPHAVATPHGGFTAGYVASMLSIAALAAALLLTDFRADGSLLPALLRVVVILGAVAGMRRLGWSRLALGIEVLSLATACSVCSA